MEKDLKNIRKKLDEINEIVKNYDPSIKEAAFNFLIQKVFREYEEEIIAKKKQKLPKKEIKEIEGKSTLGDFFAKVEVRRRVDFTLLIAYYLDKVRGVESFSRADIDKCFYDLRINEPYTTHRIMENVKKGLLMSTKAKEGKTQRFVLTRKGKQYILHRWKLAEK